jgi:hypothetical protein
LSLIEICANIMANCIINRNPWYSHGGATRPPSDGLAELKERFLRAGVGYQFETGQITRVDSQYVYAEVVKEALWLLCDPGFGKANQEFMTAHRHLREGNLRDCNTAARPAIETVLKIICDGRGWTYQTGDTVERLLAVVRREGLFPDYLGGYFDHLIGAMKAGSPKNPRPAGWPRRSAGRSPRTGPHCGVRAASHNQYSAAGEGASCYAAGLARLIFETIIGTPSPPRRSCRGPRGATSDLADNGDAWSRCIDARCRRTLVPWRSCCDGPAGFD